LYTTLGEGRRIGNDVWDKVKRAFASLEILQQYIDKALGELEERKTRLGEGFLSIEKYIAGEREK
jgi:hypothetical protein